MPLVATEELRIGFTIAAQPGNVVSPDAVERYGWQDKVEEVGEPTEGQSAPTEPAPEAAPSKPARRPATAAAETNGG